MGYVHYYCPLCRILCFSLSHCFLRWSWPMVLAGYWWDHWYPLRDRHRPHLFLRLLWWELCVGDRLSLNCVVIPYDLVLNWSTGSYPLQSIFQKRRRGFSCKILKGCETWKVSQNSQIVPSPQALKRSPIYCQRCNQYFQDWSQSREIIALSHDFHSLVPYCHLCLGHDWCLRRWVWLLDSFKRVLRLRGNWSLHHSLLLYDNHHYHCGLWRYFSRDKCGEGIWNSNYVYWSCLFLFCYWFSLFDNQLIGYRVSLV